MIKWRKHFFFLLLIVVIQYFIVDIGAWFHFSGVERSLMPLDKGKYKIYKSNNYTPQFMRFPEVNTGWGNDLKDLESYIFVVVSKKGGHLVETYYTKWGNKEVLVYDGDKLIRHSIHNAYPQKLIFIIPGIALIFGAIMALGYRIRIGSFSPLSALRHELNPREKLTQFYVIGIIAITCVIMYLKKTF